MAKKNTSPGGTYPTYRKQRTQAERKPPVSTKVAKSPKTAEIEKRAVGQRTRRVFGR